MDAVQRPKRESSLPSRYMKSHDPLPEPMPTSASDPPTASDPIPARQSASSSTESTLIEQPTPTPDTRHQIRRSKSAYAQSPGILRADSFPGSTSMPVSPSISFAPLPEIEKRKRKSSAQLGVAARSRMLQQRREQRMQMVDDDAPPRNLWNSDSDAPTPVSAPPPSDEDDLDPFVALGQFLKGASKGLWRRVSSKDMKTAEKAQPPQAIVEGFVEEQEQKVPEKVDVEPTITVEEEGRVWDTEVDATKTIRQEPEPEPQRIEETIIDTPTVTTVRALPPIPVTN